MSMHFRALAEQAMSDRAITADEILALRREGWSNGAIDLDEAEALFLLNAHLGEASREWVDFFVDAIATYLLETTAPRGYVTEGQGAWLISRIEADGRLESMAELELLGRLFEKAEGVPQALRTFALAQIEQAVLHGVGPTRDGGALEAGNVNATEARVLRRIIFSSGSERPAAVSQTEAELLFRLKNATLHANNAPEWKTLFVQGVANYLQGFSGHEPLSRERAAELESFMADSGRKVGGFLSRLARANPAEGLRAIRDTGSAGLTRDQAIAEAAEVTAEEQAWLTGQFEANGQIDEYEQALLDFLAQP